MHCIFVSFFTFFANRLQVSSKGRGHCNASTSKPARTLGRMQALNKLGDDPLERVGKRTGSMHRVHTKANQLERPLPKPTGNTETPNNTPPSHSLSPSPPAPTKTQKRIKTVKSTHQLARIVPT